MWNKRSSSEIFSPSKMKWTANRDIGDDIVSLDPEEEFNFNIEMSHKRFCGFYRNLHFYINYAILPIN
ncbi:hypothetical protein PUN28_015096 [Cardiocondyla obscurior]|uniref:Uncharacterized protein n=1 Tax=Cardiocondyla obscurior TaxID=286306 RepID=A0AAW2EX43_9HYME